MLKMNRGSKLTEPILDSVKKNKRAPSVATNQQGRSAEQLTKN